MKGWYGLLVLVLLPCCGGSGAPGAVAGGGDASGDVGVDAGILVNDAATADGLVANDGVVGEPPVAVCRAGTKWQQGVKAYEKATEKWGLKGVLGIRLSVTDFDGDGRPDLMIRNGGGPDDFTAADKRSRWLLRNTGKGGFDDVTEKSKVLQGRYNKDPAFGRPAQIFIAGDVDNDGDMDIYTLTSTSVPKSGQETSEVMLNNGDGTFSLGPEGSAARFVGEQSVPAGAAFTDFDRDGNLDLWVSHNMAGKSEPLPDRLLQGDGKGGFVDVSAKLGVKTFGWSSVAHRNAGLSHSWAWSAAACDLNNDGAPELLAASYGRKPNHLWRSTPTDNGGVLYVNESVASGYAYDNNLDWTDNISAQCHCQDHPSQAECDKAPKPDPAICGGLKQAFGENYRWHHPTGREPANLGGNSGATICADIDNDGFIDLMTNEIVHYDVGLNSDRAEVLINQASAEVRFDRPGGKVTGIVRDDIKYDHGGWDRGDMTGAVFDFDNDGWKDVYIGSSDYWGNHALLYHQGKKLAFQQVMTEDYFEHNRAHGVAVGDFDGDGDIDVVAGHSRMRCPDNKYGSDCPPDQQVHLYENQLGAKSNWIKLRLEGGQGSNRAAIGARVDVKTAETTQTYVVDGGHGHFGTQRDPTLHIGLGKACSAKLMVFWPDKNWTTETFEVEANRSYHLRQGEAAKVVISAP